MDFKTLVKYGYVLGLVVVIITALVGFSAEWLSLIVVILAILTGLFLGDTAKLTDYGVRFLTLFAVAAALDSFPFLGEYITTIAGSMVAYFAPIVLTVLLVFNYKQAVGFFKKD